MYETISECGLCVSLRGVESGVFHFLLVVFVPHAAHMHDLCISIIALLKSEN